MANSNQEQISELETRLAFLEQALDDINTIVTQQQAQISLMERVIKHLNSRLDQTTNGDIKPESHESPPPHY